MELSASLWYPVELEKLSPCGAARFLAAIFGRDTAEIAERLGVPPPPPGPTCPNCGKPVPKGHLFCNKGCWHEYSWIKVICDECGGAFLREKSDLVARLGKKNYQHIFCGEKCKGRYAGRNYGFIAHPENAGRNGRAPKWDLASVLKLREETGWGAPRLSRSLGIPQGTISFILSRTRQIQRTK